MTRELVDGEFTKIRTCDKDFSDLLSTYKMSFSVDIIIDHVTSNGVQDEQQKILIPFITSNPFS